MKKTQNKNVQVPAQPATQPAAQPIKKKKSMIPLLLIVLLVGAVGYIGYDKYQEKSIERDSELLQEGARYGYEQAINQIAQVAVTCELVPLTIDNQTINLIATECLQQAPQQ